MISNQNHDFDFDFKIFLKSFWSLILLILFFEILKITQHVRDDQYNCSGNLTISNFVISPAFIAWVYSVLPPNKRDEVC